MMGADDKKRWKAPCNKKRSLVSSKGRLAPERSERLLLPFFGYRRGLPVSKVMLFPNGAAYYLCPRCSTTLEREFMAYCDRCGQRLDWQSHKKAGIIYPGE